MLLLLFAVDLQFILLICRVSQEERSVFWEVIVSVNLKLNIEFTPSNGLPDNFRTYTGLSYKGMSGKSKCIPEEEVGARKIVPLEL
jgi:hypothetical protein